MPGLNARAIHIGRRNLRLICGRLNFATSNTSLHGKAMVKPCVGINLPSCLWSLNRPEAGKGLYITVWDSSLLILSETAMRRPKRRDKQDRRVPRFLLCYYPDKTTENSIYYGKN